MRAEHLRYMLSVPRRADANRLLKALSMVHSAIDRGALAEEARWLKTAADLQSKADRLLRVLGQVGPNEKARLAEAKASMQQTLMQSSWSLISGSGHLMESHCPLTWSCASLEAASVRG